MFVYASLILVMHSLWWQSITVLMACGGSPLEF